MKFKSMRPIFISVITLCLLFSNTTIQSQNRCASVDYRNQQINNKESWKTQRDNLEKNISGWINENRNSINQRSVLTIPVVVHIIYNSPEENISDEQVHTQIDILNEDFRALNLDIANVPLIFLPLIADVELEFCLAAVDPSGNPTSGITRKFTTNSVGIGGSTNIHYSDQGGQDAWDTDQYLNIWVAKFAGGIGGISSFPGVGPAAEDGVEINYKQFGNINVEPPYHLGRTLTHEIGHYLNLEHPWGPELDDCCASDFVDDTPETCETYIGECPSHPVISCSMPDLFMNFMFYSNDACLNMFTFGQKMRMLATLNTMRPGLIENQACEFVPTHESNRDEFFKIRNNPVSDRLFLDIKSHELSGAKMRIINLNGQFLMDETINRIGLKTIYTRELASGIYFLMIDNSQLVFVEKFVVQK